jgi:hypothetical protein
MASKELNTILLRHCSFRVEQITVDNLNEEGQDELKKLQEKVEDLILTLVAEKFLKSIE